LLDPLDNLVYLCGDGYIRLSADLFVILRRQFYRRRRIWARRANILAFFARMQNRAFGALP